MKSRYTARDVMRAIGNLKALIDEGWSISYAKKKVCGCLSTELYVLVTKHPEYVRVLNHYLNKTRGDMVYKRTDDGKLICLKKEERNVQCSGVQ